jgi:hypothetical protein
MILVQSRSAFIGLSLLIAFGLTTAVGCSGRPSNVAKKVSGTVTLGGQPLANAKVVFTPEKGNSSFGVTDAEGKYNLFWSQARGRGIEGAVIGEHTVTISTFQPGNPAAKVPNEVPEKVPYKYRQDTGKLKATVKAGMNVIDFPLEAGPVEPPQAKGKAKGKGK